MGELNRSFRDALPRAAARRIIAVMFLVGLYLAFAAESGGGLQGGALAALALALSALYFGARALPANALRIALVVGVCVGLLGAGLQGAPFVARRLLVELGIFLSVAAGVTLAFAAIAGRAHELRDGEW